MKAHVVVSAIRTPAPSPVLACFVRTPGEHYSIHNELVNSAGTNSHQVAISVSHSSTPVVSISSRQSIEVQQCAPTRLFRCSADVFVRPPSTHFTRQSDAASC